MFPKQRIEEGMENLRGALKFLDLQAESCYAFCCQRYLEVRVVSLTFTYRIQYWKRSYCLKIVFRKQEFSFSNSAKANRANVCPKFRQGT